MKFLIISDPTEGLIADSDTALSMLREGLARGHEVYWATETDLWLADNRVQVSATAVLSCEEKALPELATTSEELPITSFNGVWIRKDPPFDQNYVALCWLLALEEKNVSMLNAPSLLLRYHEKMLPFEALQADFLTAEDLIPSYLETGEERRIPPSFPEGAVISKPWLGHGGRDVELWPNLQEAFDSPLHGLEPYTIYQHFVPNIQECGDRRVIFINGEYCGDFVRIPQEGSIRANLAQGAEAVARPMNPKEERLTQKVGNFLKDIGIHIAGADYIDGRLTEINITAPTGFEPMAALGQENPRQKFLDLAESLG